MKIEIISNIFSDHSGVKLEINQKKEDVKITNMWRVITYYWMIMGQQMKSKIKKHPNRNQNKDTQTKSMKCSNDSSNKEIYSYSDPKEKKNK